MRSKVLFSLFCALMCQGACADFHRGPAADAAPDALVLVDDPVFESIHPFLMNMCMQCHSKGNEAEKSRYVLTSDAKADRPMVVALVNPADPESSLLLQRGRGEDHKDGTHLPPDGIEYPQVRDWIAGLAKKH
jgi:hypothetical protein